MDYLTELKKSIPDEFWNNINLSKSYLRPHPINKLLRTLENNYSSSYEKKKAEKLLEVIIEIKKKHPSYFNNTWGSRVLRTKDYYNEAVGTLGEYRCRQILEESGFKVNEVAEMKNKKTPDFIVQDRLGENLYIEVMTPRMNEAARKKLEGFHSREISQEEIEDEVAVKVSMISVNYISERENENKKEKNRIIDLYKRLLSNKGEANQTVSGAINILWLNFEDSDLSFDKSHVYPCHSSPFKDIYQTSNFGIWQMFYGKKNSSIFGDRTWLTYYEGKSYQKTVQQIDGYFRENNKWAGVIMNFDDCQVFYQNPWSSIEIPIKTKQSIMRLKNFDLNASWVDENNGFLLERIESKINEFERVHQIFEK